METNTGTDNRKQIDFPAELTFKAIFRNSSFTGDQIKNIVSMHVEGEISIEKKASRNGKFISYTVTANFPSNSVLNMVCNMVTTLDGFMTLF